MTAICLGLNVLTHWGRGKISAVSQTTLSNEEYTFLNENVIISIKISLKFVPKGPINNIPALVQMMAWYRLGDKPLSEPMMVRLPTHICVTRPQWANTWNWFARYGPIFIKKPLNTPDINFSSLVVEPLLDLNLAWYTVFLSLLTIISTILTDFLHGIPILD